MSEQPEELEFTEADVDAVAAALDAFTPGQLAVLSYNTHSHAQQVCQDQVKLQGIVMMGCTVVELIGARVRMKCRLCQRERPDVAEAGDIVAEFAGDEDVTLELSDLAALYIQHFAMAGHRPPSLDEVDAISDAHPGALYVVKVESRTQAPDDLSSLFKKETNDQTSTE